MRVVELVHMSSCPYVLSSMVSARHSKRTNLLCCMSIYCSLTSCLYITILHMYNLLKGDEASEMHIASRWSMASDAHGT
jgi:hypothetical protein